MKKSYPYGNEKREWEREKSKALLSGVDNNAK